MSTCDRDAEYQAELAALDLTTMDEWIGEWDGQRIPLRCLTHPSWQCVWEERYEDLPREGVEVLAEDMSEEVAIGIATDISLDMSREAAWEASEEYDLDEPLTVSQVWDDIIHNREGCSIRWIHIVDDDDEIIISLITDQERWRAWAVVRAAADALAEAQAEWEASDEKKAQERAREEAVAECEHRLVARAAERAARGESVPGDGEYLLVWQR